MGARAVIGIDIGGTKTLCALFDEDYRVLEEVKFKTAPEQGTRRYTVELQEAVRTLKRSAKKKAFKLVGVGVGCAGVADQKKLTLEVSPNIPFLKHYCFKEHLGKLTDAEVTLGNDVQVGLYG